MSQAGVLVGVGSQHRGHHRRSPAPVSTTSIRSSPTTSSEPTEPIVGFAPSSGRNLPSPSRVNEHSRIRRSGPRPASAMRCARGRRRQPGRRRRVCRWLPVRAAAQVVEPERAAMASQTPVDRPVGVGVRGQQCAAGSASVASVRPFGVVPANPCTGEEQRVVDHQQVGAPRGRLARPPRWSGRPRTGPARRAAPGRRTPGRRRPSSSAVVGRVPPVEQVDDLASVGMARG